MIPSLQNQIENLKTTVKTSERAVDVSLQQIQSMQSSLINIQNQILDYETSIADMVMQESLLKQKNQIIEENIEYIKNRNGKQNTEIDQHKHFLQNSQKENIEIKQRHQKAKTELEVMEEDYNINKKKMDDIMLDIDGKTNEKKLIMQQINKKNGYKKLLFELKREMKIFEIEDENTETNRNEIKNKKNEQEKRINEIRTINEENQKKLKEKNEKNVIINTQISEIETKMSHMKATEEANIELQSSISKSDILILKLKKREGIIKSELTVQNKLTNKERSQKNKELLNKFNEMKKEQVDDESKAQLLEKEREEIAYKIKTSKNFEKYYTPENKEKHQKSRELSKSNKDYKDKQNEYFNEIQSLKRKSSKLQKDLDLCDKFIITLDQQNQNESLYNKERAAFEYHQSQEQKKFEQELEQKNVEILTSRDELMNLKMKNDCIRSRIIRFESSLSPKRLSQGYVIQKRKPFRF